ncbi:MAG: hypothetical protein PHG91_04565 [Syntrophales bacterium]|nr:hypothetical protein [Syntrophales bacterium]MDD5531429.1 hypothetical protein [Syntrophales bacterium]
MKKMLLLICVGIIVFGAGQAMAESKPVQLSLTPDVAIYDRTTRIEGFSLGFWSENPQSAFALGLVNGSTGDSVGFTWGILVNYADNYKGVQWSIVNYNKKNFTGWQSAFYNHTGGMMKGLQTGAVNYAENFKGLQLGIINYAEKASGGVQIGVINILPENKWFTGLPGELAPGMVIVNWRF